MNSCWSYRGPTPRGLYLITPDEADTARLLARKAPLLAAGATWLQYRNKSAGSALRHEQASTLQALCLQGSPCAAAPVCGGVFPLIPHRRSAVLFIL